MLHVNQILQSEAGNHTVTGVWPTADAEHCPFTGSFGTFPGESGAMMYFTDPEIKSLTAEESKDWRLRQ